MAGEFGNPEVVEEEVDILLIGGGMACCGAAYEVMRWAEGTDLKIRLVDKAAMDRSGAVAMGLSAINTYIGTEQDPVCQPSTPTSVPSRIRPITPAWSPTT
jgi:adenylylsulfate reductase subunit A